MAKNTRMSQKLITTLPPKLQKRLDTPRLRDLTFGDIKKIGSAFKAFQDTDSIAYAKKTPTCLPCVPYP